MNTSQEKNIVGENDEPKPVIQAVPANLSGDEKVIYDTLESQNRH